MKNAGEIVINHRFPGSCGPRNLDPSSLGIQQHSIRPELAGSFRLRQFRP